MAVTKQQILDQLRTVNDPELHKDLVTLNMVKNVAYCDGHAAIVEDFFGQLGVFGGDAVAVVGNAVFVYPFEDPGLLRQARERREQQEHKYKRQFLHWFNMPVKVNLSRGLVLVIGP